MMAARVEAAARRAVAHLVVISQRDVEALFVLSRAWERRAHELGHLIRQPDAFGLDFEMALVVHRKIDRRVGALRVARRANGLSEDMARGTWGTRAPGRTKPSPPLNVERLQWS